MSTSPRPSDLSRQVTEGVDAPSWAIPTVPSYIGVCGWSDSTGRIAGVESGLLCLVSRESGKFFGNPNAAVVGHFPSVVVPEIELPMRCSVVIIAQPYLSIIRDPVAQRPSLRRSSSGQPSCPAHVGNHARALLSVHFGFLCPRNSQILLNLLRAV